MELHRLDGFDATGLDALDITDMQTSGEMVNGMFGSSDISSGIQSLSDIPNGVPDPAPEIAYEILDEEGNVVMYADTDENIYVINGLNGFFKKIGKGLKRFAKKVIKPVVRTFNRFLNPATILLRNGFLLAMKADMMKVAGRLRFGYLSESQARKLGLDMGKYRKVKKAVEKAEKIYRLAGGRGRNLRKAILKGKGNRDKKVPLNGFYLGAIDEGPEIYNDPFEKFVVEADIETIDAFIHNELQVNGLGAAASGTALAAASGAVASVAAVLSKIGNIFGKAKEVKQQAQDLFSKPARPRPGLPPVPYGDPRFQQFPVNTLAPAFPGRPVNPSMVTQHKIAPQNNSTTSEGGFFKKHKTPLLIGAGLLVVGTGVAIAMRSGKKKTSPSISGTPKKAKTKKPTRQRDALGRFTGGATARRKPTGSSKAPEKLVPKALL